MQFIGRIGGSIHSSVLFVDTSEFSHLVMRQNQVRE
jgi:hypothetical protein